MKEYGKERKYTLSVEIKYELNKSKKDTERPFQQRNVAAGNSPANKGSKGQVKRKALRPIIICKRKQVGAVKYDTLLKVIQGQFQRSG